MTTAAARGVCPPFIRFLNLSRGAIFYLFSTIFPDFFGYYLAKNLSSPCATTTTSVTTVAATSHDSDGGGHCALDGCLTGSRSCYSRSVMRTLRAESPR